MRESERWGEKSERQIDIRHTQRERGCGGREKEKEREGDGEGE